MPALAAVARDTTNGSRLDAIVSLGLIGDSAAAGHLVDLLASADADVRDAAITALGRIGPPARRAAPSVHGWLDAPSARTREAAAAALGSLYAQSFENAAALTRAARDTAAGRPMFGTLAQPRTAALAQRQLQSYQVVEPLTRALQDQHPGVRGAAAVALGSILGWPLEIRDDLASRKRMVAYVDDGPFQLRSDRLGYYDAMPVIAVCLHPTECSNVVGPPPAARAGSRSVSIDLSRPVPESGAKPLGVVEEPNAFVTVNWDLDSTRLVRCQGEFCAAPRAVTQLPVDSTAASNRVEVRFYLNGRKHLLQFGPWVTGTWSGIGGVHGTGTSRASVTRTSWWTWAVDLPVGARGRLFDISDPSQARDLGLYSFRFRLHFEPRDTHDVMPVAW